MKMFKTVLLGCAFATTLAAVPAMANTYPVQIENDLVAVCDAIKDNSLQSLRKAVKQSRLSFRDLNEGLVCNGDDMLSFATRHNATFAADLIVRRTLRNKDQMTASR
ncbi:DUF3718 domain-containing protein [Alteromonas sp. CYL-A6]|uniref:DUF3718 domain-containing protein n=1 Tax=Alteromonas nitratireducens TaxID=3390813 RepID=UPI0034C0DCEE